MRIESLLSQRSPSPSPQGTTPDGSHDPSPSRSPSLPPNEEDNLFTPAASRKRAREDYTDAAKQIARNVRFRPGSDEESSVVQFAKLSSFIQLVTLYARIYAISQQLDKLTAPDTVWEVPPVLNHRIDRCTFSILISHACASYIARPGPTVLILEHLERNPRWGVTPTVKNDKVKLDLVIRRIQKSLTTRRNVIKTILKESLGTVDDLEEGGDNGDAWDILQLAQSIVAIGDGVTVSTSPVGVSLPMLARYAFLRQCMVESIKDKMSVYAKDFWRSIDATLKKIRDLKQTDIRISRFFSEVLDQDISTYGDIDRSQLVDEVFDALEEQ